MLLSITNRSADATDLGYLLHKNPANLHQVSLPFGKATVFYPAATPEECTAVLLVEVDPVALVRSRGARQSGWALGQYVNDRPYAASSFLSTAISRIYGTALNGTCRQRPELPEKPLSLSVRIPTLPAPGGKEQIERIFRPLGYEITCASVPLDPGFPEWGTSPYLDVNLGKTCTLQSLLQHLYVLIPALDRRKHYWVGPEEIEKLLAKGRGWLEEHPERDWIVTRALKFQRSLTREALARLAPDVEDAEIHDAIDPASPEPETEPKISLHTRRLDRVAEIIASLQPSSVLDLGCGEGKLLSRLLKQTAIPRITGMDVGFRSLEIARERLDRYFRHGETKRLTLLQGSLIYRDARLAEHDVAALVEVIEHLDPPRLEALSRVVFECARPRHVIVTTPNIEYNVLYEGMEPGQLRHRDHRFEWTRAEFRAWAESIASAHPYDVRFEPVGDEHPEHGPPGQLAHFTRRQNSASECPPHSRLLDL
jgi:3' terminal RNA ribose 2'-O-methyltransferase Hen1